MQKPSCKFIHMAFLGSSGSMLSQLYLIWNLVLLAVAQDVTQEATEFLTQFNINAENLSYERSLAAWNYDTNITEENGSKMSAADSKWSVFYDEASQQASAFDLNSISNETIKLQLHFLQNRGISVLPTEKRKQVLSHQEKQQCTGLLVHGVTVGYADYGDYWRGDYEVDSPEVYRYQRAQLITDVENTFQQIKPLYEQLHAYVRHNLQKVYGSKRIDPKGCLPAHLLGDMWGRFWTNLYPLMIPYPAKPNIDVSSAMVEKGWNVTTMFKAAENFFASVGLYEMTEDFWKNSMLVEPNDGRKVVCHPTAWDLGKYDYRRKIVGVVEPLPHDETYCDPAALFHVANDYSFIRYYTRTLYQFQFQEALCKAAGHTDELYKCDITNSTTAGHKLRDMLALGRSQPWTKALESVTSGTSMDAAALLRYFQPLHQWLVKNNTGRHIGWDTAWSPYIDNAIKVRISLKTALGDNAYEWDDNEMYLFKCTIAYAMRTYFLKIKHETVEFRSTDVHVGYVTSRISFYFTVSMPNNVSNLVPKAEVEEAISISRGRINEAFRLDDQTLEFIGINPTLSPPYESSAWLIVFAVVAGLVVIGFITLIILGVRDRKKRRQAAEKDLIRTDAANPYQNQGKNNSTFLQEENISTTF
ncbi:hypothetical protein JD844_032438 [Phrynosoma platyrhinos]|uniref:Angiotensin-converting enzyme n=1 Tax=Phrynosoma platyrhinos TaxID=52577 RepID=A0ABQ7T5A9_PHRPL|nr:hypothetical protein JD844_032438 [Phrynosoma platyrhinos]